MLFTSQSVTSKQRCTYSHPLIFVLLAYSMRYPYTRFSNLVHWMQNVARWWNGNSSSHLPVLEYTDVDHCELMCLNDIHQTRNVFLKQLMISNPFDVYKLNWLKFLQLSVTNVKTILLKTWKPFSWRALSNGIVHIHGVNVSGLSAVFAPSIELKEKNMSETCAARQVNQVKSLWRRRSERRVREWTVT